MRSYSPKYAKQSLSLMRRYYWIIFTGDASILWSLKDEGRVKAMKALSMLAKLLGLRDRWRQIREAYGLKWSAGEEIAPPLLSSQTYSSMISEARCILRSLDSRRNIVEFMALSGLRVGEALEAIRLYHRDAENYLNRELMVLEHFRYPSIFLRRSKKAYVTVLDDYMLELLESSKPCSYNALRMSLRRKHNGLCHLKIFRKIWATYMKLHGIDSEIIDILQGRTPRSIFIKHYYRPDMAPIINKVRSRLQGLRMELGIQAFRGE